MAVAAAFRAELLVLRKWPAVWVLVALVPLYTVLEGCVLGYLFYLAQGKPGADPAGGTPEQLLPGLLPAQFHLQAIGSYAFFGTAVPLVLGALVAGGDWGRGTVKTALSQGPGRLATFVGQTAAVTVTLAVSAALNFAAAAACSALVSVRRHGTISPADSPWPPVSTLAAALGVAVLVCAVFGAAGLALGTVLRSAGAAIAVALVWTVAVQALLDNLALQIGGVLSTINNLTPGASAVSLTDSFGSVGGGADVETYLRVDPELAARILVGYLVVFLAAAAGSARRDVS